MRRARANASVARGSFRGSSRGEIAGPAPYDYDADVVKDACRRNSRWHALAILLEAHGRRPRGGTRRGGRDGDVALARDGGEEGGGNFTSFGGRDEDEVERSSGADSGAADSADSGVPCEGSAREGSGATSRRPRSFASRRTRPIVERMTKSGHRGSTRRVDRRRRPSTRARAAHARANRRVRALPAALRVLDESPACTPSGPRSTSARGSLRARADFAHPSRASRMLTPKSCTPSTRRRS